MVLKSSYFLLLLTSDSHTCPTQVNGHPTFKDTNIKNGTIRIRIILLNFKFKKNYEKKYRKELFSSTGKNWNYESFYQIHIKSLQKSTTIFSSIFLKVALVCTKSILNSLFQFSLCKYYTKNVSDSILVHGFPLFFVEHPVIHFMKMSRNYNQHKYWCQKRTLM